MPKKLGLFVAAVLLGACVYVGAKIVEVPTANSGVMILGGGVSSATTTTPEYSFSYINGCTGLNTGTGQTVVSCSASINVASGDLLVAWVQWQDGETTDTITVDEADDADDFTIIAATKAVNSSDIGGQFAYIVMNGADTTYTPRFTLSPSGRRLSIIVMQARPSGGTVTLHDGDKGTGSSTALLSANIDTVENTYMGFGGGAHAAGGYSFTSPQIGDIAATGQLSVNDYASEWYYIFTGQVATPHAQATYGTSDLWVCSVVAFKLL